MEEYLISNASKLNKKLHVEKLMEGLTQPLASNYCKLVPAQTWCIYWITHSLNLLDQAQSLDNYKDDIISFIKECAHKDGGYGGGPGQIAHLATTFAAINSLITTASPEALESIDRTKLIKFLHRLKQPDGSFAMHDDGEIDSRATYCALSILRCLNIHDPILLANVADWILSCQTYEGGFGSVPGSEAHGGYTFCCVASLCLINQLHRTDLPSLLRWLTNKQMIVEGGFCGRSNKLVDSCYSYWQGAVFPLIHTILERSSMSSHDISERGTDKTSQKSRDDSNIGNKSKFTNLEEEECPDRRDQMQTHLKSWLYDGSALQDYILNHCQSKSGLLRDKPGAAPDFYHTCYALSGLSLSQHQYDDSIFDIGCQSINVVGTTHPLFNLTPSSLEYCFYYFKDKKIETFTKSNEKK